MTGPRRTAPCSLHLLAPRRRSTQLGFHDGDFSPPVLFCCSCRSLNGVVATDSPPPPVQTTASAVARREAHIRLRGALGFASFPVSSAPLSAPCVNVDHPDDTSSEALVVYARPGRCGFCARLRWREREREISLGVASLHRAPNNGGAATAIDGISLPHHNATRLDSPAPQPRNSRRRLLQSARACVCVCLSTRAESRHRPCRCRRSRSRRCRSRG